MEERELKFLRVRRNDFRQKSRRICHEILKRKYRIDCGFIIFRKTSRKNYGKVFLFRVFRILGYDIPSLAHFFFIAFIWLSGAGRHFPLG